MRRGYTEAVLRHRYSLPVLSGILLALVLYPFYLWPLAVLALGPLFYFAGNAQLAKKDAFIGGYLTGLIGIGPTVFSTLFQLRILAGSELFSTLVRASSAPVLCLVACAFGLVAFMYSLMRSNSLTGNALLGASLYGALELIFFKLFGGYYLSSLAYAVVPLTGARSLASVLGAISIASAIGFIASLAAEAVRVFNQKRIAPYAALCVCLVCGAMLTAWPVPVRLAPNGATASVALIQAPERTAGSPLLGTYANGVFSDQPLESLLQAASDADLVVYPHSPFKGISYDSVPASSRNPFATVPERAVGAWLQRTVSASTSVLIWESTAIRGELFDQYAVWQGGEESVYQKHWLYPLSDYAPSWAPWDLFGHTYAIQPGDASARPIVKSTPFGGLICSELHQPAAARAEALRSPFIIAVGSDAMFPGDLMGNFSIAAARYRAAENNIPIARGNAEGPSAFINANGSIAAYLPYGKSGIVRGTLPLSKQESTPYSIWGAWPFYAFICIAFALAAAKRSGVRFPAYLARG